jgi:hypothetical protein
MSAIGIADGATVHKRSIAMNRLTLAIAVSVIAAAATTHAQVYTVYRPLVARVPVTTYYAPAPVTTYYAPAPVTTYYAPAPVTTYYAPAPVTTYYAPAPVPVTTYYAPAPAVYRAPVVVPPSYVHPGQPIRNLFRRPVVVW